jgi:GNAT superfamily N-acetyltransferase
VIRFRPFCNADPPAIAAIWRSHSPHPRIARAVVPNLLERLVFAKPYFDRFGLIIAEDESGPVGFVHAGFGANDEGSALSTELGATCLLMVAPCPDQAAVARGLLHESESYLRKRGAKVLYGGGIWPLNPFYLGLYGGSELPGILAGDPAAAWFREAGYKEIDRCFILERELANFRPPVDRRQVEIRRSHAVEVASDPPPQNWWEACTFGLFDRTLFELRPRGSDRPVASVVLWDMQPLADAWGRHAVGLVQMHTAEGVRRNGLGTYLAGEALKQMDAHGVEIVHTQAMCHNAAALGLYRKLGFAQVDEGIVFRKEE